MYNHVILWGTIFRTTVSFPITLKGYRLDVVMMVYTKFVG